MKRKYHDLQLVKVRVDTDTSFAEWTGNVIDATYTGIGRLGYEVSNGPTLFGIPMLVWEHEITPFV